jgi:hypothetical protein
MGSAACIAAVTNTAAAVGITVYLFTTEAQGHLPKFFSQWGGASFTQEFYLCEAVPSVFPDARAMYGFPACEEAVSVPDMLDGRWTDWASERGDFCCWLSVASQQCWRASA